MSGLETYDNHPVLVAASSTFAAAGVIEAVQAAQLPLVVIPIEDALDRIGIQSRAAAFWLDIDRDGGAMLDQLLDRLDAEVGAGSFPAIISAPRSLIDPIVARIQNPDIQVVADGTPADRSAALAIALAGSAYRKNGVSEDVAAEPSAARLRQLSDEVGRIAATLARLSVGPAPAFERPRPTTADVPAIALETVQQVIRARRLRARYFDQELFADPAWDMLLDLMQAEIAQHRVPVSSLCIAAEVPATTALRWIKSMTDAGLFNRRADPHDGRRVFIELAPETSEAMRRYFHEVGKVALI
jgi:DNA-binding MarR family transcriptional regulator